MGSRKIGAIIISVDRNDMIGYFNETYWLGDRATKYENIISRPPT